jgi:hypothetical protein
MEAKRGGRRRASARLARRPARSNSGKFPELAAALALPGPIAYYFILHYNNDRQLIALKEWGKWHNAVEP